MALRPWRRCDRAAQKLPMRMEVEQFLPGGRGGPSDVDRDPDYQREIPKWVSAILPELSDRHRPLSTSSRVMS